MLPFALNHMTVPSLTMAQAKDVASALGMAGLELRNDLDQPLFDGQAPTPAMLDDLAIFALAEVKAFNAFDAATSESALELITQAAACGARAIVLIPQVGGDVAADGLTRALAQLGPVLKSYGMIGLIEPIGFENSTLRHKADVIAAIDAAPCGEQFGLVHDTFHHVLAGGGPVYPTHTKLVHISGVTTDIAPAQMTDADRGLVDCDDRLGTVAQIQDLMRGGYTGPLSFEAFAPDVHADTDPKASLSRSMSFIENEIMAHAA